MRRNLVLIFLITIFQSMIFAYVIERVFAESRGLSVLEMQYLLIMYSAFSILFEIPAGAVADRWKRKYTLALGLAFCWFEFFVSIFSYSFPMFALVYLAAAIGGSLRSGTMDAILYETLKEQGEESSYVKISGRLKFTQYCVAGVVAVAGGVVADRYGYEMNYWLSLIGYPIAIVLILCLREPRSSVTKLNDASMFSHMKGGLKIIWDNARLRNVIFISGIVSAVLFGQLHEMSMLVYPEQGISVKYFGFVSIGIMAVSAISGLFANGLKEKIKKPYFHVLALGMPGVAIAAFGTVLDWWGVLFLMLAIGTLEALTVVYSGNVQDELPDELRVTVSSVSAFFYNLISVVVGLLFGYLSQLFSIHASFQMLGFILLLVPFFISKKQSLMRANDRTT